MFQRSSAAFMTVWLSALLCIVLVVLLLFVDFDQLYGFFNFSLNIEDANTLISILVSLKMGNGYYVISFIRY